jgi:hypothetical protein
MDIKVLLDLDDLIRCITEGRLPKLAILEGVVLPEQLEGVGAALIINR